MTDSEKKVRIATCTLAGCFGCHMSFLDLDERLIDLNNLVTFDKSPLTDKKQFDEKMVDVGLIEGGCANEENVYTLLKFRKHCKILVSIGSCAITGGVPTMRNEIGLRTCLETAYLSDLPSNDSSNIIPDDEELPRLLNKVYPAHEIVRIDYFIPGCPPSADAIWKGVTDLLAGHAIELPYELCKYE